MNSIQRVALVGGTHGNELTGIYLIKKFEQNPALIQRSSFETSALLGNPRAFAQNRRYIDTDLNRCFLHHSLHDPLRSTYEEQRAKEIYQRFTQDQTPVDLIVDLHSTTSNMGLTVILNNEHPFNLQMAAYLQERNPQVQIFRWPYATEETPFLRSLCTLGCAIEVGAIAQGVLQADLFQQTEALIFALLDYVEAVNQGHPLVMAETLTVYQCIEMLDYPRNQQGEIAAMIHPQLQFQDYQALHPGDPIFLTFEGESIAYTGNATVYPVFINEAAYYEKGIAMCLTQPRMIHLHPPIPSVSPGDN